MARNLRTVRAKAAAGPFSEGQLRWYIFNEKDNGLAAAGAIVRVQSRVYIDEDRFDAWIDSQNQQRTAGA